PADSDAMPEPVTHGTSAVTVEKDSGREQSVISAPADHDTVMNTEQSPVGKAESSVTEQREERRRKEVQPDMYGGEETYSGDYEEDGDTRDAADLPVTSPEEGAQQSSGEIFSEPEFSVGELDDIEYLQNEAFHLAWELAS
ncbi:TPA: chromosome partitioning protein ParB, partial [Escherichia coli]|nr:chromosome partitioning protein ParB [Escherichia coli]HDD1269956.1 chromosome partitioning protein ParB [Escherichia coli]